MKNLISILLIASFPALAQQSPATTDVQTVFQACNAKLIAEGSDALNWRATAALDEAKIAALQAQVTDLTAKCGEKCMPPKKDEPK